MKYMASFYGYSNCDKHEISIYHNGYSGGYLIYVDDEFWTTINSLQEFDDELEDIEKYLHCRVGFLGW